MVVFINGFSILAWSILPTCVFRYFVPASSIPQAIIFYCYTFGFLSMVVTSAIDDTDNYKK